MVHETKTHRVGPPERWVKNDHQFCERTTIQSVIYNLVVYLIASASTYRAVRQN